MLTLARYVALISSLGFLTSVATGNEQKNKEWWETTLVYQIWPRGFQDSDNDGEGDLKGIISKLDYLEDLGIETIWLNSIYESPFIDSGFDVSNFTNVNSLFGTMKDFEDLVKQVHVRGMKIILDFIPNHSSDQHIFFKRSVNKRKSYTDYYIWADGGVDDNGTRTPPNNWVSTYSDTEGSAWTWNNERKQWYYHKFHHTQPDFNLRNEDLLGELEQSLEFWLLKGVDGFCIHSVPYFFEDGALRNESVAGSGAYTFGLPESTALLYRLRQFVDDYATKSKVDPKLLIAESYDASHENLMKYYGNSTHKGVQPFNFNFITRIRNDSDASDVKQIVDEWMKLLPQNSPTNWVISNHENSRAAARISLNLIDGLHMLALLLPGQAYTYYGDEIAMLDTKITWEATIDPMGCAKGQDKFENFSRDPARTPMQWNSEVAAGFSKNKTTYLPVNSDYVSRNVKIQKNKLKSNLHTYKELASLRKKEVFRNGDYELASLNDHRVLVLRRFLKDYYVYITVINFGLRTELIDLTKIYPDLIETLDVVVSSSNAILSQSFVWRNNIMLTANAALVLKAERYVEETSTASTITSTTSTVAPSSSTTESDNEASSFTSALHLVISAVITVMAIQNLAIK
ncbi:maltase A3-like [Pseudomyrmex gracilis]|uniref:maltase A3-like n=1 Tax=Pseudomyrmex gracilis TaxID=219809 RepID=UPI0009951753|nr:maltase A3-like [Pseudomyrmex gracilis]XP_020290812.1 maltase A3-like [Pseudomyrmex gracilis]